MQIFITPSLLWALECAGRTSCPKPGLLKSSVSWADCTLTFFFGGRIIKQPSGSKKLKKKNPHWGWFAKQTDGFIIIIIFTNAAWWNCLVGCGGKKTLIEGRLHSLNLHMKRVGRFIRMWALGYLCEEALLWENAGHSKRWKCFYFLSDIKHHKALNDANCLEHMLFSANMSQASDH